MRVSFGVWLRSTARWVLSPRGSAAPGGGWAESWNPGKLGSWQGGAAAGQRVAGAQFSSFPGFQNSSGAELRAAGRSRLPPPGAPSPRPAPRRARVVPEGQRGDRRGPHLGPGHAPARSASEAATPGPGAGSLPWPRPGPLARRPAGAIDGDRGTLGSLFHGLRREVCIPLRHRWVAVAQNLLDLVERPATVHQK